MAALEQANSGYYEGAGRSVERPCPPSPRQFPAGEVTTHLEAFGQNAKGTRPMPSRRCSLARLDTPKSGLPDRLLRQREGRPRVCRIRWERWSAANGSAKVTVDGADYTAIADIGLRMLTPRAALPRAGFENYIIDRGVDGKKLPKDAPGARAEHLPPMARALVERTSAHSATSASGGSGH